MTDAAALNILALSPPTQKLLLRSYFSTDGEDGRARGYTITYALFYTLALFYFYYISLSLVCAVHEWGGGQRIIFGCPLSTVRIMGYSRVCGLGRRNPYSTH